MWIGLKVLLIALAILALVTFLISARNFVRDELAHRRRRQGMRRADEKHKQAWLRRMQSGGKKRL